jgi:hypothetical protein
VCALVLLRKKSYSTKRAVVMEPEERKKYAMMQQVSKEHALQSRVPKYELLTSTSRRILCCR